VSNPAVVTVTVKPQPGAALELFDFEDVVQGWGPDDFNPTAGTVATTTAFHTDGVQGLQLTGTDGGCRLDVGVPRPPSTLRDNDRPVGDYVEEQVTRPSVRALLRRRGPRQRLRDGATSR